MESWWIRQYAAGPLAVLLNQTVCPYRVTGARRWPMFVLAAVTSTAPSLVGAGLAVSLANLNIIRSMPLGL